MIEVRQAVPADTPALCAFETVQRHVDVPFDATGTPMPEYVGAAVESGECHVAIFNGELAGLVILNYSFFGFGFVALLITRERFRRKGIGSALIRFVEGTCRTERIFISTERSNGPMQMLLDALGYERSGVIENLGEDVEPELIYVRKLRTRAPR